MGRPRRFLPGEGDRGASDACRHSEDVFRPHDRRRLLPLPRSRSRRSTRRPFLPALRRSQRRLCHRASTLGRCRGWDWDRPEIEHRAWHTRVLVAHEPAEDRTEDEGARREQHGGPSTWSLVGTRLLRRGWRVRLGMRARLWHLPGKAVARAPHSKVGKPTTRLLGELGVDEHEFRADRTEVTLACGHRCRKRPARVSIHPHGSSLAGLAVFRGRTEIFALCGIFSHEEPRIGDICGKRPR